MNNTDPYRPTPEEQHFFDEIRQRIDKSRNDYREIGQWMETEYSIEQVDRRERESYPGDPTEYQAAQEERKQQILAMGHKPYERTPQGAEVDRLLHCANDFLRDQPDVTNYERHERLPLARRIIFVTLLMTDPDVAELKLGFTTLETMPWAGDWNGSTGLGRSMIRDEIIPKGWMDLARPAWGVEEAAIKQDSPSQVPVWDDDRRELRIGDRVCKKYRQIAGNQIMILREFETDGWPSSLADPLPGKSGVDHKRRLRDTVHSMNSIEHLKFECDGTGEGIIWSLKEAP